MAYSTKIGTLNTGTSSANIVVTGVGFQPKAIIFWWGGSHASGSDDVGSDHQAMGIGAVTGTTQRWAVNYFESDAAGTSDPGSTHRSDACVAVMASSSALSGLLDLVSFDTDGFTLAVDDTFAEDFAINYLCLGGSDLTNAKAQSDAIDFSSTGNKAVTGVGFQPDVVLFASCAATSLNAISSSHSRLNVAWAKSSSAGDQGLVMGHTRDNQATMDTYGYGLDSEIFAAIGTSSINGRASFVSRDSDGYTVNVIEGVSSIYMASLSLKGGQYTIGDLLTQTDTTTDISETLSYQPVAVLLASAIRAKSTADTPTANSNLSIGAFTGTSEERAAGTWSQDNIADSETSYAQRYTDSYVNVADDAIQGAMHCYSVSSSGFVMRMSDADPAQKWVTYLAIGPASGDATVAGVVATASATALTATITGGATVAGALASATAQALAATITGGATVSGVTATASAAALAPSAIGGAIVTGVTATASAQALEPSVSAAGSATVAAVTATASAQAIAPSVSGGAIVAGALATATGAGLAPTVTAGAVVAGVTASASAAGLAPAVIGGANVAGTLATATGAGLAPTVTAGAVVAGALATATGAALAPTVSGAGGASVAAVTATAAAQFATPTVSGGAVVSAAKASASAEGLAPTVVVGANVVGVAATASGEAIAPTVSAGAVVLAPCAQAAALFGTPDVYVATLVVKAWTLDERNLTWTLDERSLLMTLDERSLLMTLDERSWSYGAQGIDLGGGLSLAWGDGDGDQVVSGVQGEMAMDWTLDERSLIFTVEDR